ncbi:MAG: hypothetical protein DMG56_01635 [Acidobacteria bacterium]|nr:MAG: hypothetical protein DMG56_01635 [Acidobacteriota bacterium]PYU75265.1 MAG: hypothetical protein DMG52_08890 [Acidobacteriota bacterium]
MLALSIFFEKDFSGAFSTRDLVAPGELRAFSSCRGEALASPAGAQDGEKMEYLPGFTVQCINPQCAARGHWLRADITAHTANDGRCPCCGDFLRNVPPPLGPRFRMRPRSLTARPPLPPRPR